MILAKAELIFHWGFWVRHAMVSSRQDTYVIPQPSTLVGALSYGFSRAVEGICGKVMPEINASDYTVPTAKMLIENGVIEEVYFRVLDGYGFRVMDITRHFQAPYLRYENLKDITQWFGIKTVGKVYAPSLMAEVAYLINDDNLRKVIDAVCDGADHNVLIRGSLISISRVGPLEGLVSVKNVGIHQVREERISKLPGTPCPYFSVKDTSKFSKWAIVSFWNWKNPNFWSKERFPPTYTQYAVPLDRESIDAGILAPFKPCNILDGIVNAYVVREDGTEHVYPRPE